MPGTVNPAIIAKGAESCIRLPDADGTPRWLLAAALAANSAAAAGPSVDLALVLALDSSASVDAREFGLQRGGLAAAFRDRDVLERWMQLSRPARLMVPEEETTQAGATAAFTALVEIAKANQGTEAKASA